MPRANPYRPQLNAGEISPLMEARTDFQKYAAAAATLENFVPLVQGGATLRPGTRFVAEARFADRRCRLVAFEFSTEQAYVIEFGHLYCRFYRDGGRIASGSSPYQIVTPYAEADLEGLSFTQSADTLYIVHRHHPPRTLTRTGHTAWVLEPLEFRWGPFLDENVGEVTLSPSATSGTVTITASAPVFEAGHVGAAFQLRMPVDQAIRAWSHDTSAFAAGALCHWRGNYYQRGTDTGDGPAHEPPTHTEGTRSDGRRNWLYLHSGVGWVRITAYTSPTTVTAEVQPIGHAVAARLPFSGATTLWSEGAWSEVRGYPEVAAFHEQRLWFARDQTLWASQSADFTNFRAGPLDADALIYTLSADQVNRIRWLAARDVLMAGTAGGEWVIRSSTLDEPITPTNVQIKRQTTLGSAPVRPVLPDSALLFVQLHGRKLHELAYSADRDGFAAPDLTLLAEHVTGEGIVDLAMHHEPHRLVHCVRSDGAVAALTYQRPEDVIAWSRWLTDGVVEGVAAIPGTGQTELWLIVRRMVGGSPRRYVERLDPFGRVPAEDALHLDCALSYDGGSDDPSRRLRLDASDWSAGASATLTATGFSPFSGAEVGVRYRLRAAGETGGPQVALVTVLSVSSATVATVRLHGTVPPALRAAPTADWQRQATVISGLGHLEGRSVAILADGAPHPPRIVAGGQVALERPAGKVHAGLPYRGLFRSPKLDAGGAMGAAVGQVKRVHRLGLVLLDTLGLTYGPDPAHQVEIPWRRPVDLMDLPPQLFSGELALEFPGEWETDPRVVLVQPAPLPATILAYAAELKTNER